MGKKASDMDDGGLSRRTMIKAAGIGSAAVWAPPLVDSLISPAASGSAPAGCSCSGITQCYNGPTACHPANALCFCRPTGSPATGWDGGCSCRANDPTTPAGCGVDCGINGECPAGLLCVQTCCAEGQITWTCQAAC